ncbi:hypothetical protein GF382_03930, partial [Candidatus Falkowbacteria bacterium]|nr:hypothetical protein [Candidatus Falkowbacteria bacterium]
MPQLYRNAVFLDSTLRDGNQGGASSSNLDDCLKVINMILELQGPFIVEAGFANPGRKDDIARIKAAIKRYGRDRIAAFGRLNDNDVGEIERLRPGYATLVAKARRKDAAEVWGDPDEQFKLIAGYIKRLKDRGIKVIFDAEHFFTAYFSGKRYAQKLLRTALDAGAEWVVLCDTTGEMNTD